MISFNLFEMEKEMLDLLLKKLEEIKDGLPPDICRVLEEGIKECNRQELKNLILQQQKKIVNFCLELDWLSSLV